VTDAIYREAQLTEIPTAVELRARMMEELSSSGRSPDVAYPGWRDRFVEFFRSRMAAGNAALFFAEREGRTIGMAAVYKLVNHRSEIMLQSSAYITSVYVEPAWRKRGLAAQLVRMTIAWAKANDCAVARLRTSEQGRSVYTGVGFAPSDEMEFPLED
jgi:GNAT superfamily N-acetyltransferase